MCQYPPKPVFDASKLLVDVHTPSGKVLTDRFQWSTSTAYRNDRAKSPSVSVNELGTYRFTVKNDALWDWNGILSVKLQVQRFEKPYFYLGIAGYIVALLYVTLVTASTIKTKHKK
jgi:hypothetical protein